MNIERLNGIDYMKRLSNKPLYTNADCIRSENYFKNRFNDYSKKRFECLRSLKVLDKMPVCYWLCLILFCFYTVSYDIERTFNVSLFSTVFFQIITVLYCTYCGYIFGSILVLKILEKRYLKKRIEYFNLYVNSKTTKRYVRALNIKSNKL